MIVSNWVLLIEDNGYVKINVGWEVQLYTNCIMWAMSLNYSFCIKSDQLLEVWINYPSLTTKYPIKP